jgi:hypothetical protein
MNNAATTANTTIAITDSSVGGASWIALQSVFTGNGKFIQAAWYKIANANDHNGGTGITITTTASGGSGTELSRSECDVFRLPSTLKLLDVDASAKVNTGSSVSTLTVAGTSRYSMPDPLAWSALGMSVSNGGVISAAYTNGASSSSLLSPTTLGSPLLLNNEYTLGGVPASPGSCTWAQTWTTAHVNPVLIGATFIYTATDISGNLLPILNNI